MLPSTLGQQPFLPILAQNLYCCGVIVEVRDCPDLSHPHSCNLPGHPGFLGRCEEKFIVFAAMERKLKIGAAGNGNLAGDDPGGDAAFFTDVGEVHGEAIAQIDHGGGQPMFSQPASNFDPG